MKYLIMLLSLPLIVYSKSAIEITAGSLNINEFDRGSSYGLQYTNQNKNQLGYDIGLKLSTFSTDTNRYTQLTIPNVGIRQTFKFNKLPFSGYIGAGFGLALMTPTSYGQGYIETYLKLGMNYRLSKQSRLIAEYRANYGETQISNKRTAFDGSQISIGIGYLFLQPKQKPKYNPEQYNVNRPNQPQRQRQVRRSNSSYQQTQQLMNDLSWPTY
ncbi:MAG: hypothetical protein VW397_02995 [Candidatus Margulisiibacteriota bacterium]